MTEWDVNTALNHHAGCSVYDDGACTCGLRARTEKLERSPLAPGDGTWSVFAQRVVEERDAAREEVTRLRAERDDAIEQARRLDELYEAACADIGDLQGKMDRLRAEVDSLVEAADAARLLLLFAAGPHEAGVVPAMLAAAIERAKGVKDAKGEK